MWDVKTTLRLPPGFSIKEDTDCAYICEAGIPLVRFAASVEPDILETVAWELAWKSACGEL